MIIKIVSTTYLLTLSRFILGTVFIIASVEKIAFPEIFAANIAAYRIIPTVFVNLAALVIPWLELICGIFLIGGVFIRSSSVVLSVLLCFFILLLILTMARDLKIDCGCFGVSNSPVTWWRVVEDIGLLILGFHIYFFTKSRESDLFC